MGAIPVSFTGVMWYPDLSVGGGPMPGGPPPSIWPSPGVPTHPIYYPPHPSHPIYWPGGPPGASPPGFWGGGMGPGVPPQPGIWPNPPEGQAPIVSHPIAPGGPPPGIWGGPYFPPVIWPNPPEGQAPIPSHPIVLPPDLPPTLPPPDSRPIDWKTAWTPTTGWVVIGIPSGPHPAPAATPPAAS